MVKHFPKILASEEKAITTTTIIPLSSQQLFKLLTTINPPKACCEGTFAPFLSVGTMMLRVPLKETNEGNEVHKVQNVYVTTCLKSQMKNYAQ